MGDLVARGLDGSNPLGFLAALGVLRALEPEGARLKWEREGAWCPVFSSDIGDMCALVARLNADRLACVGDPALALEYDGKRDLKPPPQHYREYLQALVSACSPQARRSVDWAASFATDVAVDRNGNTKPTALHFTAGQQQFLQMANDLATNTTENDLREALDGPWQYTRPLPVMGWDSTMARDYALRATDPSTDKKAGVPGADWLGLRGLAFLLAVPVGPRVVTTGCEGGWKDGTFRWPLWSVPLDGACVRSLLALDLGGMTADERVARGIDAVLRCGIKRSDQGGYGSFEPATVG